MSEPATEVERELHEIERKLQEIPQAFEAFKKARANAMAAVDVILEVMHRPERNSATRLAAAKLVLEVAGVNVAARDALYTDLMRKLSGKLSASADAEFVQALCKLHRIEGA